MSATNGFTCNDILPRVAEAPPGERVLYFRGDLAGARAWNEDLDLLAERLHRMAAHGEVHLMQRRTGLDQYGLGTFDYLAIKPRRGGANGNGAVKALAATWDTDRVDRLRRLDAAGISTGTIAQSLGVSRGAVKMKLDQLVHIDRERAIAAQVTARKLQKNERARA